jgi:hypothetical protein
VGGHVALRVYVNRRMGEVRFNLEDVARGLGIGVDELICGLDEVEVSTMPLPRLTESDYTRFCRELEG